VFACYQQFLIRNKKYQAYINTGLVFLPDFICMSAYSAGVELNTKLPNLKNNVIVVTIGTIQVFGGYCFIQLLKGLHSGDPYR
jgi:hypothetical protein